MNPTHYTHRECLKSYDLVISSLLSVCMQIKMEEYVLEAPRMKKEQILGLYSQSDRSSQNKGRKSREPLKGSQMSSATGLTAPSQDQRILAS